MARPALSFFPGMVKIKDDNTWKPVYEVPTAATDEYGVIKIADNDNAASQDDTVYTTRQINNKLTGISALPSGGTSGQVLKINSNGVATWMSDNDTKLTWTDL